MSDVEQNTTGEADANLLRFNLKVGESLEMEIAADGHELTADRFAVAAWVTEDDVDMDVAFVPSGYKPMKGDKCKFTRSEDGLFCEPVTA